MRKTLRNIQLAGIMLGLLAVGIVGCTHDTTIYSRCDCLKVHFFEEDIGRSVFLYQGDVFLGIIEDVNDGFMMPSQAEIIVCEGQDPVTGGCDDFVYRFALDGECE